MNREGVRVAEVEGPIPVEQVWTLISKHGAQIPRINMLEVRPDGVRIVGLKFEEYLILAAAC